MIEAALPEFQTSDVDQARDACFWIALRTAQEYSRPRSTVEASDFRDAANVAATFSVAVCASSSTVSSEADNSELSLQSELKVDTASELRTLAEDLLVFGEFADYVQRGSAFALDRTERDKRLRDSARILGDALQNSIAGRPATRPLQPESQRATAIAWSLVMTGDFPESDEIPPSWPISFSDELDPMFSEENSVAEIRAIEEVLSDIDHLTGLAPVKAEVNRMLAMHRVTKERTRRGLDTSVQSRHMVMTGPPGTGKTTIARLVSEAYRSLGDLRKGHMIECDRNDLIGEYVGQTAPKTTEVIDSAMGGVLFIDEAYSLTNKASKIDYGSECVATLLKRMEDDRDDLIVIVAGYAAPMAEFLESNPGLKSRFGITIDFPSYSVLELQEIARLVVSDLGYTADDTFRNDLSCLLERHRDSSPETFGNAREVRRLVEASIRNQAARVATSDLEQLSDADFIRLTSGDLEVEEG